MSKAIPTRRSAAHSVSTQEPPRHNYSEPEPGCEKRWPTSQRTDDMLDDGFEDRLREAAREYNEPPETPREAMWTAIQSERPEARKLDRAPADNVRTPRFLRPLSWAAGIAALLGIGVGLGRLSLRSEPGK